MYLHHYTILIKALHVIVVWESLVTIEMCSLILTSVAKIYYIHSGIITLVAAR